jgi:hypothetical protein
MSSATCCMTSLVSFPSKHIRIEYTIMLTDQRGLRTINDHRDLVVDGLYTIINAGHSLVDTGYPVVDAGHHILDTSDFIIDSMCSLQNLCSCHSNFFICQFL